MESNITPFQFIICLCGCAYIFYLLIKKAPEEKDNEDDLEHMGFV
jgi:threonine/homoserine/homoserine lactone efflux protein